MYTTWEKTVNKQDFQFTMTDGPTEYSAPPTLSSCRWHVVPERDVILAFATLSINAYSTMYLVKALRDLT
jgi:hypothetical protein